MHNAMNEYIYCTFRGTYLAVKKFLLVDENRWRLLLVMSQRHTYQSGDKFISQLTSKDCA